MQPVQTPLPAPCLETLRTTSVILDVRRCQEHAEKSHRNIPRVLVVQLALQKKCSDFCWRLGLQDRSPKSLRFSFSLCSATYTVPRSLLQSQIKCPASPPGAEYSAPEENMPLCELHAESKIQTSRPFAYSLFLGLGSLISPSKPKRAPTLFLGYSWV